MATYIRKCRAVDCINNLAQQNPTRLRCILPNVAMSSVGMCKSFEVGDSSPPGGAGGSSPPGGAGDSSPPGNDALTGSDIVSKPATFE